MNHLGTIRAVSTAALLLLGGPDLFSQGYGVPLTFQGLQQSTNASVSSRGMAGVSVGQRVDASLMFDHPASLSGLDALQIVVGGVLSSENTSQQQRWIPMRILPTFSLMMEGILDHIPDPDYTETPDDGFGPEDTIGRAYDSIRPDWSHSSRTTRPMNIAAALPLTLGDVPFVVAAGISEYANLSTTYRNNNVLDPSIGTQRPSGFPRPQIGQEIPVMWSRIAQSREGSLFGYGVALSAGLSDNVSMGVSGRSISGSTDDTESDITRGRIWFGNNDGVYYYRLDSVYASTSTRGTSSFTGLEFSASLSYRLKFADIDVSVVPPTTIERSYTGERSIDTTGTPVSSKISVDDKIVLPWRWTVGLSVVVREDVRIAVEYGARPFAEAAYTPKAGATTHPWLSSYVFCGGIEYAPLDWLTLRGGLRRDAEVFEQEGNPIPGESVPFTVLTVGMRLSVLGASVDLAYERANISYQDMWQTNVNINKSRIANVVANMSYSIR